LCVSRIRLEKSWDRQAAVCGLFTEPHRSSTNVDSKASTSLFNPRRRLVGARPGRMCAATTERVAFAWRIRGAACRNTASTSHTGPASDIRYASGHSGDQRACRFRRTRLCVWSLQRGGAAIRNHVRIGWIVTKSRDW
jgi:hypothetical protein